MKSFKGFLVEAMLKDVLWSMTAQKGKDDDNDDDDGLVGGLGKGVAQRVCGR